MAHFLTQTQNKILDLVFEIVGEERYNRSYEDYMGIAARLPALKQLHYELNKYLASLHDTGRLPMTCRRIGPFKFKYGAYPREISMQTLRLALTVSGMRKPKHRWLRRTGCSNAH